MSATAGSLYLAGFAQLGDPHAAIVLATSSDSGKIAHITAKSGQWAFEFRTQKIEGSVSLTSLLKIRDASRGTLTSETLQEIVSQVAVPKGAAEGECLIWVSKAVQLLAQRQIVTLTSAESLAQEFTAFCNGNKSYATSSKYPNIKTSSFCF